MKKEEEKEKEWKR